MKYGLLGMAAVVSLIAANGPAAAVSPIYSWTGFYVGGNLGYSWGSSSTFTTFENASTGAVLATDANRFNMDGVIGGGLVGSIVKWCPAPRAYAFRTHVRHPADAGLRYRRQVFRDRHPARVVHAALMLTQSHRE